MFVPPSLWPFNVQEVLEDCLVALEKGKRLNSRHRLLRVSLKKQIVRIGVLGLKIDF